MRLRHPGPPGRSGALDPSSWAAERNRGCQGRDSPTLHVFEDGELEEEGGRLWGFSQTAPDGRSAICPVREIEHFATGETVRQIMVGLVAGLSKIDEGLSGKLHTKVTQFT